MEFNIDIDKFKVLNEFDYLITENIFRGKVNLKDLDINDKKQVIDYITSELNLLSECIHEINYYLGRLRNERLKYEHNYELNVPNDIQKNRFIKIYNSKVIDTINKMNNYLTEFGQLSNDKDFNNPEDLFEVKSILTEQDELRIEHFSKSFIDIYIYYVNIFPTETNEIETHILPETVKDTTQPNKIKWTGTPGEFGAIFNELIDKGFINTIKDKKNMVRVLNEIFEITNGKEVVVGTNYLYKCFKDKIKNYPPNTFKVPYSDNYHKGK